MALLSPQWGQQSSEVGGSASQLMPPGIGRPQCLVVWPHGLLHRTAGESWQLGSWLFLTERQRDRQVNRYLKMGATAFYNLILE